MKQTIGTARSLTAALITFGSLVTGANAATITFADSANGFTISVSAPIALTSNQTGFFRPAFSLVDVYTVDYNNPSNPTSDFSPGGLFPAPSISLPAGGSSNFNLSSIPESRGVIDENDLLLLNPGVFTSISSGDDLTLPAGTYEVFDTLGTFLPDLPSGVGSIVLVNYDDGAQLSSPQSVDYAVVPEPSSFAIFGLGSLALVVKRRRK